MWEQLLWEIKLVSVGKSSAKGREVHAQLPSLFFAFSPIICPINLLRLCLQLELTINHYLLLLCLEETGRKMVFMRLQVGLEWSETSRVVRATGNIAKIKLYGEGSRWQYRKIQSSQSPMDTMKLRSTYLINASEGDSEIKQTEYPQQMMAPGCGEETEVQFSSVRNHIPGLVIFSQMGSQRYGNFLWG